MINTLRNITKEEILDKSKMNGAVILDALVNLIDAAIRLTARQWNDLPSALPTIPYAP